MATFPASVEAWRPYFNAAAGDIPIDFILAWIRFESAGNPCSFTGYHESGIIQLMPPHDTSAGNTTEERLRSACVPGTQRLARPLTDEETAEQVVSSVTYINRLRGIAHERLTAVGANWPETSADFWAMVKLYHTLPSLMQGLQTSAAVLGRPPASWDEFVKYGAGAMYGGSKWLPFTAKIGAYGDGGGTISVTTGSKLATAFAAIGGLVLGAWLTTRHIKAPWSS